MVKINMKKLADNSRWISREFREFSTSYAWWVGNCNTANSVKNLAKYNGALSNISINT